MNDTHHPFRVLGQLSGRFVMATVVESQGSTYRGAGARMLFRPADGDEWTMYGTISGGCLEHDVLERAKTVLETGFPALAVYDTTNDEEDLLWGMGLGCNGIVTVFLEAISEESPFARLLAVCERDNRVAVCVTAFESDAPEVPAGTRLLGIETAAGALEPFESESLANPESEPFRAALWNAALSVSRSRVSTTETVSVRGRTLRAFAERLAPPQSLYVVGAGFDAAPVVRIASLLGWRVTVADSRPVYVVPERFPEAYALALAPQDELIASLAPPPDAAMIIMTHRYAFDYALLRRFLPMNLPYIGVLGPKKRTEKLLAELASKGVVPDARARETLYSPVGLDIGTETAEEVALAIVAEIQAVLSGRRGGFLRERATKIHAR